MRTYARLLDADDQETRLIAIELIMVELGNITKYKRKPVIIALIKNVTGVKIREEDFNKWKLESGPANKRR